MSGTEDFSYVAEEVPSMFICLGAGGPEQYPHHNPRMTLDESVFFKGTAIYANCAMEWLDQHGNDFPCGDPIENESGMTAMQ